ncbi:UNVERIFIED_CONTAM: hypothetical protein Sindi_2344900 [Sesamum indicum]
MINLRFLRPCARHILSEDDIRSLVLPFTPTDVKHAVFDIVEDKAPGPDGYSSGFFKAAWPIVGQKVSSAVLDFFNTGRFLKQINTTLLALILKAYDTVEWDFLIAVMELFGFPYTFVNWIEACVTTPSFSVGLNGKPHGFFKGARGLWQGDPLSPVTKPGFFNWDLLLFYRADMDSIGVFKIGLDRFAEWSGLRLNVQKSHLIISRSPQGLREEMLGALGFQEGFLPMRYLGLPLLSSRLTVVDCSPLLFRIDKRIAGWEGAIGPQFGLNGFTRVGYETPPFGRLGNMEAHGVGGKFYVYRFSSTLWWTIRSEMGGNSTFGRTRAIISAFLVSHFHGDRGYSEWRNQPD